LPQPEQKAPPDAAAPTLKYESNQNLTKSHRSQRQRLKRARTAAGAKLGSSRRGRRSSSWRNRGTSCSRRSSVHDVVTSRDAVYVYVCGSVVHHSRGTTSRSVSMLLGSWLGVFRPATTHRSVDHLVIWLFGWCRSQGYRGGFERVRTRCASWQRNHSRSPWDQSSCRSTPCSTTHARSW